MLQDPDPGRVKPQSIGLGFQPQRRLLNRFFRQVKRAPMYGDEVLPLDVSKYLQGFFRRDMSHLRQRGGTIGSDWDSRKIERTKANPNLLKYRIVTRVPGEEDPLRTSCQGPRA